MAEVEFGGMKFKGGKIFVILTLLSTLAGGLWAGFEFYKDYMDMRDKIETYTAPDLSDYDKRIDLAKQKLDMLESEISLILDEVNLVASVASKIVKNMGDKGRYDETNQLKTLVVMQVLGNTKTFFDTQKTLQDTENFFDTTTVPDNTISDSNYAQYIMFGGSDAAHSALVDSQY